MDTIAPEILIKIFSYVCEGKVSGEAGCTLALVSRRFRDVSFLVRFETISLKGLGRMRLFLEMLEDAPTTPIIRHMLLYDGGHDEGPVHGVTPIAVCTSIIHRAAPTLVSLAGDLRSIAFTYQHLLSQASFPRLRDLSLGCRSLGKIATTSLPHLPNLRRLHKFDKLTTEENLLAINSFTKCAPSLTHIRISNFNLLSSLPRLVDAAIGREKSSKLRLPKGLKRLIVQGEINDGFQCYDPDMEEQWRIIRQLQSIAATRHGGVLYVPEWGDYESRDCELDWREVVEGRGDGCWSVPTRETFSLIEYKRLCEHCPMLSD